MGRTLRDEEVYNSRAVRLKGGKDIPWIVTGQCLKLYLVDEQLEEEEINFITVEEAEMLKRQGKLW